MKKRVDKNRVGTILVIKENKYVEYLKDNTKEYFLNFYDYLLYKIEYNIFRENLSIYYEAKRCLDSLAKGEGFNEKKIIPAFKEFQREISLVLLKANITSISDITITKPAIWDLPSYKLEDAPKHTLFLADIDLFEDSITKEDICEEFFRDIEGEGGISAFETVDLSGEINSLLKKAYWYRWMYNRDYFGIIKYDLD